MKHQQNKFYFTYGNENIWIKNTNFRLQPNQTSYVVVTVNQNTQDIVVYVNGTLADRYLRDKLIIAINRNWLGGDRAFNGLIKEAKITNGVLTREEIKINSELVQQNRAGL